MTVENQEVIEEKNSEEIIVPNIDVNELARVKKHALTNLHLTDQFMTITIIDNKAECFYGNINPIHLFELLKQLTEHQYNELKKMQHSFFNEPEEKTEQLDS